MKEVYLSPTKIEKLELKVKIKKHILKDKAT